MNSQRLAGIVLLVVGIIVLTIGLNASHSAADRWTNFFTGHFTDSTVWYIVGGVVLGLVGLSMFAFNGKARL
ncbi:MAG: DUF3185 family protein [Planctomycetes bacterium]|nr:DUF3185 family protein [Planctomycetota bacterium]